MAAVTGAPVSGSQTKTFVSRPERAEALAIPVVSPPPPHGMRTASNSSRSSTSSRPIVPFPAITGGSWTGWTKKPSTPSPRSRSPSASTAAHHCSHDTRTILPPRRSTAASFVIEALSGTTIVAGTPSSRAIQATPCAMFPVLVVTSPSRSASGGALSTAFAAPRSLNDAIGCRFSSFSQISAGASHPEPDERRADDRARDPLARRLDVGERDQNGDLDADAALARASHDELGGREVLDRDPERLEDRQLVLVLASGVHAGEHLAELGLDVIGADRALLRGEDVVARLVQARLAAVGEERGVGDRLGVELARRREARADGVDVRAAREPALLDDRLDRGRRRADHLGAEERGVDRRRDRRADLARELLRLLEVARPDPDLRVVEHRAHRVDVAARLRAGAEDRDPLRVRARERSRRDGGHRRRTDLRDRRRVHDREQLARLPVVQEDAAHVRVESARRVGRRR